MHQLVPPLILEHYVAGRYRGDFAAVGLFVDISGFSTLTDALMKHGQHGAEVLARIMRRVFGLPSEAIFAQGGFIVGYAGDAFTALFPLGDDPALTLRRALAAAWKIQTHLQAEPQHITEYGTFPISAKVGLALGEAAWGVLRSTSGKRAVYYFRGSAINGCSDAEHQAKAGEIILARNVYESLGAEVETESQGEFYSLTGLVSTLPAPQPLAPPSAPDEAMRAFFPPELLYQDFRSEFRQAVNLFISLPDPPDEELAAFMQAIFDLQGRYGGLFTRLDFGDKGCNLLLLWGAPVTYENDLDRALNFILELQARASFQFRAGLTYYISRAGFMGSDRMEEFTCYGWGINLAARLMFKAAQGEIWLDERVARRIQHRFEVEFIGAQSFKGFAEQQKVFALRGRKEIAEVFFTGEMVGREAELQQLVEFVAPLWEGKYAGPLTVWGDPGMGKSRLLHEFQVSPFLATHPTLWALCQSDQILRSAFNPFSYWLRRYFKTSNAQTEASNKANFEAKLADLLAVAADRELAEDLDRTRTFLAALLNLRWPDSPYEQMDARARYDNTFTALVTLLKLESLRQPVILFLEDAQYLDDDSEAFVIFLTRSLKAGPREYPVAILSTSRREGAALPLEQALLGQEIDLGRLSAPALAQLAGSILGSPASGSLLGLLEERADGNPFFAEQILRYLREEALLELTEDGWGVVAGRQEAALPVDLKTLLIARLDQLAHEVKNVIQTASVLGREFEILVLARMLQDDPTLPDEVAEAEHAAIWQAISAIRYLFKHALLRDTAYTMQMQARREELHQLAVEAFEDIFAGQLASHYGELAWHAEMARLAEKGRFYLEKAADQARIAFQNGPATDFYLRALALTPAEDLEAQYRLRLGLDEVYDQVGNRAAQTQNLEQLRQLAASINDAYRLAEVSKLETAYLNIIAEHLQAIESAKRTLALAQPLGAQEIAMRAYAYMASSWVTIGKYVEAAEAVETGLPLARALGHLRGEAQQLNLYGLVALKLRDPEAARARWERGLELYQQAGNLRDQINPLGNLGYLHSHLGDYTRAQDYYEKALANTRQVGDRVKEAALAKSVGFLLGSQGDFAQAIAWSERGLRLARETAHRNTELYSLLNLSAYCESVEKLPAALEYALQALALARETNDHPAEAWAQHYRGHAQLALGHVAEAKAAYQAALELNQALNQPVEATEPAAGLARIALQEGDFSAARQCIDLILPQIERDEALAGTDQPLRVYATCYRILQASQETRRASLLLRTAYRLLMARLNNISSEALRRTFLENIPYHREILREWEARNTGTE